jgi:AcrR family transcriptional regulator
VLRQKQMETRRQRAMDAAESLIRKSGTTDFTMLALAELSQLSPATPYNLFGSKAGLMYALLNRCMDQVDLNGGRAAAEPDPFLRALKAAGAVADFFLSDPDFFRPLYQFLIGVSDPVHRPAYMDRGLEYWRRSISGLEQAGLLHPDINGEQLGRELEIHFVGVLDLWVQRELDGPEFRAQTLYGATLLLLSVAEGKDRERLLAQLKTYRRKLPRNFSFSRAPSRLAAV